MDDFIKELRRVRYACLGDDGNWPTDPLAQHQLIFIDRVLHYCRDGRSLQDLSSFLRSTLLVAAIIEASHKQFTPHTEAILEDFALSHAETIYSNLKWMMKEARSLDAGEQ